MDDTEESNTLLTFGEVSEGKSSVRKMLSAGTMKNRFLRSSSNKWDLVCHTLLERIL